jgi:hypothetical protein
MSNAALLLFLIGTATPVPTNCEIVLEEVSFSPGDEARALHACETARSRFGDLFGDPVPEVRVHLWDQPGYRIGLQRGRAVVFWPTTTTMTPNSADTAAVDRHLDLQWREVLPHEIAHLLLAARFFPDNPAAPAGGYGTPLPDWLDEAVAIWAEPDASRERRLQQARELPPARQDLRTILASPHPAAGRTASYIARDGTARQADDALWAFYPQAIAVLAFVHERGGPTAVQELVQRLIADPTDPMPLSGHPEAPTEIDDLMAAWDDWMEIERSTP